MNWITSNYEKIFPVIIVILHILSCGMYIIKGDFPRSLYWFGGALLSGSVTFLIK